jgi:ADP-ribosyl-[dinitrogen reductase] hydrolase
MMPNALPSTPTSTSSQSGVRPATSSIISKSRAIDTHAVFERALGAYIGLAVGDALGATVEFMSAQEIASIYGVHDRIVGGGWLELSAGEVTDDTQMCMALGDSLLQRGSFSLPDVAEGFAEWLRSGPPDCGHTCRRGIRRYMLEGTLEAPPNEGDAGNGALMRNLPIVLASLGDDEKLCANSLAQARITHNHPYSDAATLALARMTTELVLGAGPSDVERFARALSDEHPAFGYVGYRGRATAYVVDTVCTVLCHFFEAEDFESALVATVNCGDDADTTGALIGMLAGARFGRSAIPSAWLRKLDARVQKAIEAQTRALLTQSSVWPTLSVPKT